MKLFNRVVSKARRLVPSIDPIRVSRASGLQSGSLSRVEAMASSQKLWFESETNQLRENSETWACALYFTALKSRRPLALPGEIDAQLLGNLVTVRKYAKLWWQFEG